MTPEGKVKSDIKKFLDSLGSSCWYFSPMMMGYGKKGVPDIIGCYKGYFFAIEVKAPGKIHDTTPWQEKECSAIAGAMGTVMVVDDVEGVRAIFKTV